MIAACLRCHGHDLWAIKARDAGAHNDESFVVLIAKEGIDSPRRVRGWYEYVLCGGCGHTIWYARDYDGPEKAAASACADCGGHSRARIERLIDSDYWSTNPLQLVIGEAWTSEVTGELCRRCGLVDWRALQAPAESDGERCACGHAVVRTQVFDNSTGYPPTDPRPITTTRQWWKVWAPTRSHGRLDATVCTGCKKVEWYAHGLEALKTNEKIGLRRVRDGGDKSGPYR